MAAMTITPVQKYIWGTLSSPVSKNIETNQVTFVEVTYDGMNIHMLSSQSMLVNQDLRNNIETVDHIQGEKILAQINAAKGEFTRHDTKRGTFVLVNNKLLERRPAVMRALKAKTKFYFVDGTATPEIDFGKRRPNRGIKNAIEVYRRLPAVRKAMGRINAIPSKAEVVKVPVREVAGHNSYSEKPVYKPSL